MNLKEVIRDKSKCIFCCQKLEAINNVSLNKISVGMTETIKNSVTLSMVNNSIRLRPHGIVESEIELVCSNRRHQHRITVELTINYDKQIYENARLVFEYYSLSLNRNQYSIRIITKENTPQTVISKNNDRIVKAGSVEIKSKEDLIRNVDRLFLMKQGMQI